MLLPGDKSIAIRALLLASVARAPWRIGNLPAGDDVQRAMEAARALGASVDPSSGVVVPGPMPSDRTFDAGGSATLLRLASGLLLTRPGRTVIRMDAQLAARPHAALWQVLAPWTAEGAVRVADGVVTLRGVAPAPQRVPVDIVVRTPSPSAQLKGAALFAALGTCDRVTVQEEVPTRAHTEELLEALGADIAVGPGAVTLRGPFVPPTCQGDLPGDPSSSALLAVACAQDGGVAFEDLSATAARLGFFAVLERMGGGVARGPIRSGPFGPTMALRLGSAALRGVRVERAEIPALVDEVPALAALCGTASGPSRLCGLSALRHKESDRVAQCASMLRAFGVGCTVEADDLVIQGRPDAFPSSARIHTAGDHRIAMAALALGRAMGVEVSLDDDTCIAKSFPGFGAALDAVRPAH